MPIFFDVSFLFSHLIVASLQAHRVVVVNYALLGRKKNLNYIT